MAKGKGGGSYPNPKGHTGPKTQFPQARRPPSGGGAAGRSPDQGEPERTLGPHAPPSRRRSRWRPACLDLAAVDALRAVALRFGPEHRDGEGARARRRRRPARVTDAAALLAYHDCLLCLARVSRDA